LVTGPAKTFTFPNASGTIALQNDFSITQVFSDPAVAAPVGVRVDALATCTTGKAIGVGMASTLPVQVEDMLIDENFDPTKKTVRITVRAVDANTSVAAVALCMSMP
jgi:hypothetical protein